MTHANYVMRAMVHYLIIFLFFTAGHYGWAQPIISEFQAANSTTLLDEDGDASDWIELYNPADEPVNLSGWALTDDVSDKRQWLFPSTNIGPSQFLVVFASGKDRRMPGSPLHANFKLSASGEYLALIKADGFTIASEFAPVFPPQASGLSFGFPAIHGTFPLLAEGAAATFLVPSNGDLGANWVMPGFADENWTQVESPIGFHPSAFSLFQNVLPADLNSSTQWTNELGSDVGPLMRGINTSAYMRFPFIATNLSKLDELKLHIVYQDGFVVYLNGMPVASRNAPVAVEGGTLADGIADWSNTGQQGYRNWYYGYYNKTGDDNGTYDPNSDFNDTDSQWKWNEESWVFGSSNATGDLVSAVGWRSNGANSGEEHWVIRRWISGTTGTATAHIDFAKTDVKGGNGTTLRVFQNGVPCFTATIAFNDDMGIHTNLVLTGLNVGDRIDFALDPTGTDGGSDDTDDDSYFHVWIDQSPAAGPEWNSAALTTRAPEETGAAEEIDLTAFKDLLITGTNLLAIQGLTASVDNEGFIILPELTARSSEIDVSRRVYFTSPSPGGMNGDGAFAVGPIVDQVVHTPSIPQDDEDILVQARVTPFLHPIQSVTLQYRIMFGGETAVQMYDDGAHADGVAGDGIYGGAIPASVSGPGQMVRYYISAADKANQQTRSPAFADPEKSAQYYGTVISDTTLTNSRLPVIHWFVENPGLANTETPARCSLFYEGEFYDNIVSSLHGQSTRYFPKPSYNLYFNSGNQFLWSREAPRVGNLKLLSTWADKTYMRNILAYQTYRDSGVPGHFAFPVRIQQNGAFFSVANIVENGDADFLKRLGLDSNGALYKMNNQADNTWDLEKKTRRNEGAEDLQALITGMSQNDTVAQQAFMFDHLDLPEIINFLAAQIIIANTDCCHKNYYLYCDNDGTGEWQVMPWDVDLSFGRVFTWEAYYFDETMFTNQPLFSVQDNKVMTPIFDTPDTRQMFLRRLRTLMDTLFQPPTTPAANDFYRLKTLALRDQIAPDAALDLAKWGTWGSPETITQAVDRISNEFLPGRREFLFQTMSVTNYGEIPPAQSPNASVQISDLEYRPASGNPLEEWISFTNASENAIDISGWKIAGAVRFQFKPGTVIPSHGVLFASPSVQDFRRRTVSPQGGERRFVVGPYEGNLSAWGESLKLSDTAGRIVDSRTYQGDPSLLQQYLRITELMYHPSPLVSNTNIDAEQFEYLVLRNIGPVPLDLTGVHFTEGIQFNFGSNNITSLPAGARILLVRDINAFTLCYGSGLPVAGQYTGSLANEGEGLRLEDKYSENILEFSYNSESFPASDGHGFSLVVKDDTIPWSVWGETSNWEVSGPMPDMARNQTITTGVDGIVVPPGRISSILLSNLLANDADSYGDHMTVTGVSPKSDQNAPVFLSKDSVLYIARQGILGNDRFTYTVTNDLHMNATGRVDVLVAAGELPSLGQCAIVPTTNGYRLRFGGVPGRACEWQRSPDMMNWDVLSTGVTPAHGIFIYVETNGTANGYFYRAVQQ